MVACVVMMGWIVGEILLLKQPSAPHWTQRLYAYSAEVGQLSSPLQVSLRQGGKPGSSFFAWSEREISTTFAGSSSLPIVASWGPEARKFGLSFSHCSHPAVVMGTPWALCFRSKVFPSTG